MLSDTRVWPTSITTAPVLDHIGSDKFSSADGHDQNVCAGTQFLEVFRLAVCKGDRRVTGLVLRDISTAMGVPTMLLRPSTTQCFPSVSIS